MRTLLGVLVILTMAGCAGSEAATSASKELFSTWTNGSTIIDLTGVTFGTLAVTIQHSVNTGCDCTLDISGSQSSGSASLHDCTHYGPGGNTCAAGTVLYTYTNSNAALNLCEVAASCTLYH